MIDIYDLAQAITDTSDEQIADDVEVLEEILMDKYGLCLAQLHELIEKLLPMIVIAGNGLTGFKYKGFADTAKKLWLANIEVRDEL